MSILFIKQTCILARTNDTDIDNMKILSYLSMIAFFHFRFKQARFKYPI